MSKSTLFTTGFDEIKAAQTLSLFSGYFNYMEELTRHNNEIYQMFNKMFSEVKQQVIDLIKQHNLQNYNFYNFNKSTVCYYMVKCSYVKLSYEYGRKKERLIAVNLIERCCEYDMCIRTLYFSEKQFMDLEYQKAKLIESAQKDIDYIINIAPQEEKLKLEQEMAKISKRLSEMK